MTLLGFEFCESFPERPTPGVLYISTMFATSMHICCCGCGHQVVTPLRPNRWSITFDGETVSLTPSVGNAGLACRSHYFIRRNEVVWCRHLSLGEATRGQAWDGWQQAETSKDVTAPRRPLWSRLRNLFK